jgi:type II secretory pathway component PulF
MPIFKVSIIDRHGAHRAFREEAANEPELRERVRARGLWPLSIQPEWSWRSPARLTLPTRDFVALLHQLDLQLRAGVTADVAIGQLAEDMPDGPLREVLAHLHREVSRGRPIHEACGYFGRIFPAHLVAIIAAGETSAQLPEALRALAAHLTELDELKRTARRAMVYPLVVLTATGGLVAFLIGGVVPQFAEMFRSAHIPLPAVTLGLIRTSECLRANWLLLLGTLAALVIGCVFAHRSARWRLARDWSALRIPLLGSTQRCLATARFAAYTRLLIESGRPLLAALTTGAELAGNAVLERHLLVARNGVAAGRPLHAVLPRSGGFPPFVFPALKAGETAGRLGEALKHIEAYAASRAKETLGYALTLLEPMLLAGLTVLVGLIALSFFLPIFSLYGSFNAR